MGVLKIHQYVEIVQQSRHCVEVGVGLGRFLVDFPAPPRPLSSLLLADPNLRLNLGSGPPFKGLIWGLYFAFFLTLKKLFIFLFIENNLKNNFYLSTNFMFFKTFKGGGGGFPPNSRNPFTCEILPLVFSFFV